SKKQEEEDEEDKDFPKTLKEAFDQWYLEGAVLSGKAERRAIYRMLTKEEIEKLKSSVG
ncbi:MAG TPA: proteasome subunit alpha, partial [Nitrospina sp.]|nr:proteasome subunit alpha [Nitrospina sp.]